MINNTCCSIGKEMSHFQSMIEFGCADSLSQFGATSFLRTQEYIKLWFTPILNLLSIRLSEDTYK